MITNSKNLARSQPTAISKQEIDSLFSEIKTIVENARKRLLRKINQEMVIAYWHIGQLIVEKEQKGKSRADYGSNLLKALSEKMTLEFGKGFSETNLRNMRQFYLLNEKHQPLADELSWSHQVCLLKVENPLARDFYKIETIKNNWNRRELNRQINSQLFERLALSKDKGKVVELSREGQILESPKDAIKDPVMLDFLGLEERAHYLEKDLEQALIDKLQQFLLELGKGFAFVARQKRITIGGRHFYIDLVLYNYVLKSFVLIDLKIDQFSPADTGNINFYVNYWDKNKKIKGDNPTLGIVLCAGKDEAIAEYALGNTKNLFATEYKTYLPTPEELQKEVLREKAEIEEEFQSVVF